MQRDTFDALVQRLQRQYERRPWALRLSVVLWVLLGYLVLLGWVPIVLILGGVAVFGGTALPGAGIWLCLGALLLAIGLIQTGWLLSLKIEPPKGVFVTRHTAPGLFEELDRVSAAQRCRQFHRVCLTADFNAGVVRTPRFAWLGWSRTSLSIGWPLFAILTLPEARAVLAHEFAHLSRDHGRFQNWLYGLHQTWPQLVVQLQSGEQNGFGRRLLGMLFWFLNAYWPRLNARLSVLSRVAEYEADRQAADLTGADAVAGALWRIDCSDLALNDEFWPELRKTAGEQSEPYGDICRRIRQSLEHAPQSEHVGRWLELAAHGLTDEAGTHPSFADRAQALDLDAESYRERGFPVPPARSACDELFGRDAERFEQEVSAFWQRVNRDEWRRRHGRSAALQRRLSALDGKPAESNGDANVLWERATALAETNGCDAAEPILRQLLAADPDHVYANLMLGQHLLERQPQEGVELLRRVMLSDQDDAVPQAGELLAEHFRRTGDSERLQTLRRHLSEFDIQVQAARKERSSVTAADTFLPHDLSESELEPLLTLLASKSTVAQAWLAQKSLRHFTHRRLFVLCVESVRQGWTGSAERDAQLVRELIPAVRLPGQTLVIAATGSFARIAKRVKKVPESSSYRRQT